VFRPLRWAKVRDGVPTPEYLQSLIEKSRRESKDHGSQGEITREPAIRQTLSTIVPIETIQ
jgi:hypothetical protein